MDEPINRCERHGGVLEDFAPFAEGLVGRDEYGAAFVASADQLEQHRGLCLIFGDIDEIVQLCVAQHNWTWTKPLRGSRKVWPHR